MENTLSLAGIHISPSAWVCVSVVFANRLVGGMEVLTEMERIATDAHDKPQVSVCSRVKLGRHSHLISEVWVEL